MATSMPLTHRLALGFARLPARPLRAAASVAALLLAGGLWLGLPPAATAKAAPELRRAEPMLIKATRADVAQARAAQAAGNAVALRRATPIEVVASASAPQPGASRARVARAPAETAKAGVGG